MKYIPTYMKRENPTFFRKAKEKKQNYKKRNENKLSFLILILGSVKF